MAESDPLRVVIVDDEPLGRERIDDLLNDESGVDVVARPEDGETAVEAIRELEPDLVFLDIEMPRMSGIEVVREVGPEAMPCTVFVTAYDQYALQAFDLAAVDYLVKPFSDERFQEAFRRARRKVELEDLSSLRERLRAVLAGGALPGEGSGESTSPSDSPYLKRIAVQKRGRMRVVPVSDIDYISASGVYAELHVGSETHLVRTSLRALEEQLDPEEFFRIHRSEIVRLDRVELLLRESGGSYQVQLESGEKLPVGRSRREELESRLGRI